MKRHAEVKSGVQVNVRRIHRRDLNRTWEFLKKVFRDVNRETVEYQRPRSKQRFFEIYAQEGIEQLLFEVNKDVVGYAECAFDASGDDNWVNPRYFDKRGMRPLYVEELAVHPDYQGQGVGSFMLDQLQHLARMRGCTHLVLEVAENNEVALNWYRKRNFQKLDAAIFMAQKLPAEPELLPPRKLKSRRKPAEEGEGAPVAAVVQAPPARATKKRRAPAAPVAPSAVVVSVGDAANDEVAEPVAPAPAAKRKGRAKKKVRRTPVAAPVEADAAGAPAEIPVAQAAEAQVAEDAPAQQPEPGAEVAPDAASGS